MKFLETSLTDAFLVQPEKRDDNRGFFARILCQHEFAAQSLVFEFVQANLSHNENSGTLRGMHFQHSPHAEVKLVRCVRGGIFDVIVDLRPESASFRRWQGFELTASNANSLYVPTGFAHGFITLTDDTDVMYHVSHFYTPSAESGIRYNDPAIGIEWPVPVTSISDKDTTWRLL